MLRVCYNYNTNCNNGCLYCVYDSGQKNLLVKFVLC